MQTAKLFFLSCLIACCLFATAQPAALCPVKYDTLRAEFLAEVNADILSYRIADAIVQDNLIFLQDAGVSRRHDFNYRSDSVFLTSCEGAFNSCALKECADMGTLIPFYNGLYPWFQEKMEYRHYRKRTFTTPSGLKYIRFTARLVCVNTGRQSLYVPNVETVAAGDWKHDRCRRAEFGNCFLIMSVSDFKIVR